MIRIESALLVMCGILSGIAIAYMQETKRLERLNSLQAETIKELRDYIEWADEDHSKIYTRRVDE